MIAVGVHEESALAIFNLRSKKVLKSSIIRSPSTNKIIVNQHVNAGLEFMTIGSQGSVMVWRLEIGEYNDKDEEDE